MKKIDASLDIAIAGAGIVGLTAALSLHAAGFKPTIYEAVDRPQPLGVGINLLPHAVRELSELGLLDELRGIGVEIESLVYLMADGRNVWREPRGLSAGYHWPQIAIHRGKLQMFLLDKVRERLGADAIRFGHKLDALVDKSDGWVARFVNGATGQAMLSVKPDLLLGADGIHSAVRRHFYPQEGRPKWNGVTLWRSITRLPVDQVGPTMIWAGYSAQKFVAYPIEIDRATNEVVLNWICDLRQADPGTPPPEDWNSIGERGDFLPGYADWKWAGVDVPAIVNASGPISVYPMMDRDPLPQWTFGNITLVGDAAHPMYPIGSNGATQGIIDARVLAYHLASQGDVGTALAAYEAQRRPATNAIVLANREQGPDLVLELAARRAPDPGTDLDLVLPVSERKEIAARYKTLAGFAPADLNARPSFSVQPLRPIRRLG
jgi:2-polyprenyl-6-methoxyphenol hydroxylase-like FAD-dependent oxidoreductase